MFPELQTKRLLLRQVQPEDQLFVFEGLSHPDVIQFYGVRYASFEATKAQLDWYAQLEKEGTGLSWIMVEKSSGLPVGDITVYLYKPEHKKAEVGFWLVPQFWDKGFASEALQAIIDYWKNEKALHRLEAFVEEGNEASSKLLKKNNFVFEGTMRDCEVKNGRYISLHIYALLLHA